MKRIVLVLLFVVGFISSFAAGEINYISNSWSEIKAKAKAEHKYIFMDCYTDWCGWCKVMDKETMADPGVVAVMNDKFITVKMDMEKGEGIKLAAKYHVAGFPTFMFFDPNGEYVYQVVGYKKKDEFIKELNNAGDRNKQFHTPGFTQSLDVDYPEFYKNIFAGNGKRTFPDTKQVVSFLDQQKDLYSEVSWGVVSQCDLDEKYTAFFYDNISKYKALYGPNSVNDKLNSLLGNKLQEAIKDKSEPQLNEVLAMVDKYMGDDAASSKIYCRINFYKECKEWAKCAVAMDDFVKKEGFDNTSYINSLSWAIYENCDDKALLKKAAGWMKGIVAKEPKYSYLDTYAAILNKSGQRKDAELWANKAIAEGKKSGSDVHATEELLQKIKAGK